MPTIDDLQQEQNEFESAYAEDPKVAEADDDWGEPGEQEEAAEDATASDGDAANDESAMTVNTEEDAPAGEAAAGEEEAAEDARDPKDIQREKSWEGRLRAREEQLKAREAALAARERGEPVDEELPAEESREQEEQAEQAELEQAAEAVQSGRMSVDEAVKTLSSDFGEEFAQTLSVLIEAKAQEVAAKIAEERASAIAEERTGKVKADLDGFMSGLQDERARAHFEAIADAHPDFMELAESDAMKTYLAGLEEDARAKAEQTAKGGTARQVIKLLSDVKKASAAQQDQQQDPAMDDAEGVRSTGMSIPKKPTMSDDYESAWNSFS